MGSLVSLFDKDIWYVTLAYSDAVPIFKSKWSDKIIGSSGVEICMKLSEQDREKLSNDPFVKSLRNHKKCPEGPALTLDQS
jgi:hypothetical protein